MMSRREQLLEDLQKRRQELIKEREKNKDNVAYQIGRVFALVIMIGVPLVGLAWLVGVI